MSKLPSLSVIMPVYNNAQYVGAAIDSVLQQSHPVNLEFIIVDDGSTDVTPSILQNYLASAPSHCNYKLITSEHVGYAEAMNIGMRAVSNEWLAFVDSDDFWVQDKLAQQFAAFAADPTVAMIFGQTQQFISPELTAEQKAKLKCPTALQPGLLAAVMLCKSNIIDLVGYFDTTLRKGPFIDWFARAQQKQLRHKVLPTCLYHRRLHTTNMGVTNREDYVDYFTIIKRNLLRQREVVTE